MRWRSKRLFTLINLHFAQSCCFSIQFLIIWEENTEYIDSIYEAIKRIASLKFRWKRYDFCRWLFQIKLMQEISSSLLSLSSKVTIEYKIFLTKRESLDIVESDVEIAGESARTLIRAYFWRKKRKKKNMKNIPLSSVIWCVKLVSNMLEGEYVRKALTRKAIDT